MNKRNLELINKIDNELKEIDSFLFNYIKKPRKIKLSFLKQSSIFSLKINEYGFLSESELDLREKFNNEIIKVVRKYRDELVEEQEKLWKNKNT